MKIYLEFVIFLALISIVLFWRRWDKRSKQKLLERYNPDDDKSRKGEEVRTIGTQRTNADVGISSPSFNGLEQLEGGQLLPTTETDVVSKTKPTERGIKQDSGKNCTGFRKILKRIKKSK